MMNSWPDGQPTQANAVTAALTGVSTTIAVAQGLAASGRQVDLSGLDAAAGLLCAQVLDLPPQEGARLLPALSELQGRLATLSTTLSRHAE